MCLKTVPFFSGISSALSPVKLDKVRARRRERNLHQAESMVQFQAQKKQAAVQPAFLLSGLLLGARIGSAMPIASGALPRREWP
jgi:hypothetical protein